MANPGDVTIYFSTDEQTSTERSGNLACLTQLASVCFQSLHTQPPHSPDLVGEWRAWQSRVPCLLGSTFQRIQSPAHFLGPSPQESQPPGPTSRTSTTFSIKGEDFPGIQDMQVTTSGRPVGLRAFPAVFIPFMEQ